MTTPGSNLANANLESSASQKKKKAAEASKGQCKPIDHWIQEGVPYKLPNKDPVITATSVIDTFERFYGLPPVDKVIEFYQKKEAEESCPDLKALYPPVEIVGVPDNDDEDDKPLIETEYYKKYIADKNAEAKARCLKENEWFEMNTLSLQKLKLESEKFQNEVRLAAAENITEEEQKE